MFSLGCVMFECLVGVPPYMADTTTGSLARVAGNEDVDVEAKCAGAPKRIVTLLRRMLAKQPSERPASMEEVIAEMGVLTTELRNTGAFAPIKRTRRTAADSAFLVATGERRLVAIIAALPKDSPPPRPQLSPSATADLGNMGHRRIKGFF